MDVQVIDDPARYRFEVFADGAVAGFAQYRAEPGRLIFTHTEVLAAFAGQGLGSRLAAGALDAARARNLAVVPRCSFIASFIRRHEEYADLVAGA